jgi:hypothetical protein
MSVNLIPSKMNVVLLEEISLNMLERECGFFNVVAHRLSKAEVAEVLKYEFTSAIGHEDLAKVISSMFGVEIPVNRINVKLEKHKHYIVFKYSGPRLEPGTICLPEHAEIDFFLVKLKS